MTKPMNSYQAWNLSVYAACENGSRIPLPQGVQLSDRDYDIWQQRVRYAVSQSQPFPDPVPSAQVSPSQQTQSLWDAVEKARRMGPVQ